MVEIGVLFQPVLNREPLFLKAALSGVMCLVLKFKSDFECNFASFFRVLRYFAKV